MNSKGRSIRCKRERNPVKTYHSNYGLSPYLSISHKNAPTPRNYVPLPATPLLDYDLNPFPLTAENIYEDRTNGIFVPNSPTP